MNKNNLYWLIIACTVPTAIITRDHHPMTAEEIENYGRHITIKNLSPAKLTITVLNDPENPTRVIIAGNDTGSILVNEPKLNVHIEANNDGKILKTNFKRKNNTENYWEISIRKAIISGITLFKRDSRPIK